MDEFGCLFRLEGFHKLPQVVIHEVLAHVSDVQRRDALVFRWCQLGHRVVSERKPHLVIRRSQFKSNVLLNF